MSRKFPGPILTEVEMRRLLIAVCVVLVSSVAQAGGPVRDAVQNVRQAVQEWRQVRQEHRGGCGCASAPQSRATAAPTPVVQTTSYAPPVVASGPGYTPMRLGFQLPTVCSGGNCR